jgi:hypothetical protein
MPTERRRALPLRQIKPCPSWLHNLMLALAHPARVSLGQSGAAFPLHDATPNRAGLPLCARSRRGPANFSKFQCATEAVPTFWVAACWMQKTRATPPTGSPNAALATLLFLAKVRSFLHAGLGSPAPRAPGPWPAPAREVLGGTSPRAGRFANSNPNKKGLAGDDRTDIKRQAKFAG